MSDLSPREIITYGSAIKTDLALNKTDDFDNKYEALSSLLDHYERFVQEIES